MTKEKSLDADMMNQFTGSEPLRTEEGAALRLPFSFQKNRQPKQGERHDRDELDAAAAPEKQDLDQ